MKGKDWFISITVGIVFGVVVACIGLAKPSLAYNGILRTQPTTQDIAGKRIRDLMLQSHNNWESIQVESVTTWYSDGVEESTWVSTISINQPSQQVRFELSHLDQKPILYWMINNNEIHQTNLETGENTQNLVPAFILDNSVLSMLPTNSENILIEDNGDVVIVRHPLTMIIPTAMADYIFPTGLAQRSGVYNVVGSEQIVGRDTWIVDYSLSNGAAITMHDQLWVDQATGMILKAISYANGGTEQIISETVMTSLILNPPFTEDTFKVP